MTNYERQVWWVNQGSSYRLSSEAGFLWTPIVDGKGVERSGWKIMTSVKQNDVILHSCKGSIRAVSRALSNAYNAPRPLLLSYDTHNPDQGHCIDAEYFIFSDAIPVSMVAIGILQLAIDKGPLDKNGQPKQSYMHKFSWAGLQIIRQAVSQPWPTWIE